MKARLNFRRRTRGNGARPLQRWDQPLARLEQRLRAVKQTFPNSRGPCERVSLRLAAYPALASYQRIEERELRGGRPCPVLKRSVGLAGKRRIVWRCGAEENIARETVARRPCGDDRNGALRAAGGT